MRQRPVQASVSRDVKISKVLSHILRHSAVMHGISIQADGYCRVDAVLACHQLSSLNTTRADFQRVVERDQKGRFQMDRMLIRAVQGHSIKTIGPSVMISS